MNAGIIIEGGSTCEECGDFLRVYLVVGRHDPP